MLSIIVAMDRNRVIGKDNKMPWRLPAEQQYFKRVTMGHPVVMGRKTHESIGRPLPGRPNIVVTRDRQYQAEGCAVVHSVEEALALHPDEETFVIGGAEIIRACLDEADRLYITYIDHAFEGDTFLQEIDPAEWEVIRREPGLTDENNPYTYEYRVYARKRD